MVGVAPAGPKSIFALVIPVRPETLNVTIPTVGIMPGDDCAVMVQATVFAARTAGAATAHRARRAASPGRSGGSERPSGSCTSPRRGRWSPRTRGPRLTRPKAGGARGAGGVSRAAGACATARPRLPAATHGAAGPAGNVFHHAHARTDAREPERDREQRQGCERWLHCRLSVRPPLRASAKGESRGGVVIFEKNASAGGNAMAISQLRSR